MTQKAALILAAAATAFVLVAAGGVTATLAQRSADPQPATTIGEAPPATPPPLPAAGEVGQVALLAAEDPAPEDRAARIAREYLGDGVVGEVEREKARGVPAYKVELRDGREVAVDLESEQVIYAQLGGKSGSEHEHEREQARGRERGHEEEHDD